MVAVALVSVVGVAEGRPIIESIGEVVESIGDGIGDFFEGVGDFFGGEYNVAAKFIATREW